MTKIAGSLQCKNRKNIISESFDYAFAMQKSRITQ